MCSPTYSPLHPLPQPPTNHIKLSHVRGLHDLLFRLIRPQWRPIFHFTFSICPFSLSPSVMTLHAINRCQFTLYRHTPAHPTRSYPSIYTRPQLDREIFFKGKKEGKKRRGKKGGGGRTHECDPIHLNGRGGGGVLYIRDTNFEGGMNIILYQYHYYYVCINCVYYVQYQNCHIVR